MTFSKLRFAPGLSMTTSRRFPGLSLDPTSRLAQAFPFFHLVSSSKWNYKRAQSHLCALRDKNIDVFSAAGLSYCNADKRTSPYHTLDYLNPSAMCKSVQLWLSGNRQQACKLAFPSADQHISFRRATWQNVIQNQVAKSQCETRTKSTNKQDIMGSGRKIEVCKMHGITRWDENGTYPYEISLQSKANQQ